MDKEFQALLLKKLQGNKVNVDSIHFKRSHSHTGEIKLIGIEVVYLTSQNDTFSIGAEITDELLEEVVNKVKGIVR